MRLFSMFLLVVLVATAGLAHAEQLSTNNTPTPSYDRAAAKQLYEPSSIGAYEPVSRKWGDFPGPAMTVPLLKPAIECFDFDTNPALTGFYTIPPDPHDAVGPNHVINIGNVTIEWREKANPDPAQHTEALVTFFGSIPGPSAPPLPHEQLGTLKFDPKVIYDQYAGRFVVVALEQWDMHPSCGADPSDESRILIAVSKTSDPNLGWWFHVIDSKIGAAGLELWADYPGLAVDDKAIYITMNMFPFCSSAGSYTNRLWIVDKTWYAGPDQSAGVTIHDPVPGGYFYGTQQPAHMYGPPPIGSTGSPLGTWLVMYDGLTAGGVGAPEYLQLIEVTDPLGPTTFTGFFVISGDIEDVGGGFGFPALPDAPQLGGLALIEVNDRRSLNAVWRNENLYACSTVIPNAGPDAGHTTAHWWRVDTTVKAAPVVADHGNVGAEDLTLPGGSPTYTFFPSVMVDCGDNMAIGFSASNSLIYCGAYYAGRYAISPPAFIGPTCVLQLGLDYYFRTFCGPRNRWGDYSGLALCPVDESTFWVYNEYAGPRGTPLTLSCGTEDGRWHTKLGCFRLKQTVAVAITSFDAIAKTGGVELQAVFESGLDIEGVNVYRSLGEVENPTLLLRLPGDDAPFRYFDEDVEPGNTYTYRIGVVDADGEFLSPTSNVTVGTAALELAQNAPNPFNPTTTISFVVPSSERVRLTIYDASGRLVRTLLDEVRSYGSYDVVWDGKNDLGQAVSSGVYLYRIAAGNHVETKKMTLLK
jgi:hypothetical protein